jgi:DnaJ-class molecular chaperone
MNTWRVLLIATALLVCAEFGIANYHYYEQGQQGRGRQQYHQQRQKPKKPHRDCYYLTLGIPKRSDYKLVKKTFKKLALQLHPDKVSEDQRDAAKIKFEKITEAYDILSDAGKKNVYDAQGFDGLDEWNENESMRQQQKAQQEQYQDHQKEQICNQIFTPKI